MKRRTKALLLILLLVTGVIFLHIRGVDAIMLGISTEELTKNSDVVLKGRVGSVRALWSEDGKSIITQALIVGPSIIKGSPESGPVIVEYPGGEIGDIGMKVSDVEPLKEGEEVILFLKAGKFVKEGRIHHLVGNAQGKYVVGDDGIARKKGFSLAEGAEKVDNNIPADELIEKIRRVR
jgi:hypothetical protein